MTPRTTRIVIIGLTAVSICIFASVKLRNFLRVDDCLDKGGSWNYKTNQCEFLETTEQSTNLDSLTERPKGYNQLANKENIGVFTISEYNTDMPDIKNIERPTKSEIINPKIDTTLLFNIWTLDPKGPHADFHISRTNFYVVDYDGNGAMPYILDKNHFTIFYNDFKQGGQIISVTRDSLTIKWSDASNATKYLRWRN